MQHEVSSEVKETTSLTQSGFETYEFVLFIQNKQHSYLQINIKSYYFHMLQYLFGPQEYSAKLNSSLIVAGFLINSQFLLTDFETEQNSK